MTIDDSNWKEELLANTSSKFEEMLLTKGAKSVNQGYLLNNLYKKWARLKGIQIRENTSNDGQFQSSFNDFEKRNTTNKK
tara:strand:+ start:698 stop:937 length:240 start_codon:yes stop_codon:yes gene_type:complete